MKEFRDFVVKMEAWRVVALVLHFDLYVQENHASPSRLFLAGVDADVTGLETGPL